MDWFHGHFYWSPRQSCHCDLRAVRLFLSWFIYWRIRGCPVPCHLWYGKTVFDYTQTADRVNPECLNSNKHVVVVFAKFRNWTLFHFSWQMPKDGCSDATRISVIPFLRCCPLWQKSFIQSTFLILRCWCAERWWRIAVKGGAGKKAAWTEEEVIILLMLLTVANVEILLNARQLKMPTWTTGAHGYWQK